MSTLCSRRPIPLPMRQGEPLQRGNGGKLPFASVTGQPLGQWIQIRSRAIGDDLSRNDVIVGETRGQFEATFGFVERSFSDARMGLKDAFCGDS